MEEQEQSQGRNTDGWTEHDCVEWEKRVIPRVRKRMILI